LLTDAFSLLRCACGAAFAMLIGGALLAAQSTLYAQTPGKVMRVSFISPSATAAELADPSNPVRRGYEQAMRERGYVDGRNLITERRTAEGRLERIPEIVAELVRLKSDVIVVGHVGMAQLATKATTTTPIFSMAGDPIARGLAKTLNRPGGNINGIFAAGGTPEGSTPVEAKRLQLLLELVPNLRRVAFVANREWWDGAWGKGLREAASQFGVQFLYVESTATGFGDAFAVLRREKPDAVYFESTPTAFNLRAAIGEFAVASRIPSACGHQELVEAGCLMTYNFTAAEAWGVLADFVERIAKGAKAGELPYRQYTRYELAVNATTAKAIGLTIPQALLTRADRVIE
jgi:putative ABC transport system substrate-binding protein